MNNPTLTKLNESFTVLDADTETMLAVSDFLKVEDESLQYDISKQFDFDTKYKYFTFPQNGKLLIYNGHVKMVLNKFPNIQMLGEKQTYFTEEEIDDFYNDILPDLPFPPYDFQYNAFKESLMYGRQINVMSTSSGKSYTISLICEFFRRKKMRGLLLVPNINLLTQFHNDIKDYNLNELYDDVRIIGGGHTERVFDKTLVISTWQSLQDYQDLVKDVDFVICDELQYYASDVTSEIVQNTMKCIFKLGFTGTIPEDKCKKMTLIGLFEFPKTYITPRQLIDRGLATPIEIKTIRLRYKNDEKLYVKQLNTYLQKLSFIKEHENRQKFCVELLVKVRKFGNTLGLFQHTEHGKSLFMDVMKMMYPDVVVENKHIVGKKSFEFQKQYGVYFLNGEDDAKTRERTRKILEECVYEIEMENGETFKFYENDEVKLSTGETKKVKYLDEGDDIEIEI